MPMSRKTIKFSIAWGLELSPSLWSVGLLSPDEPGPAPIRLRQLVKWSQLSSPQRRLFFISNGKIIRIISTKPRSNKRETKIGWLSESALCHLRSNVFVFCAKFNGSMSFTSSSKGHLMSFGPGNHPHIQRGSAVQGLCSLVPVQCWVVGTGLHQTWLEHCAVLMTQRFINIMLVPNYSGPFSGFPVFGKKKKKKTYFAAFCFVSLPLSDWLPSTASVQSISTAPPTKVETPAKQLRIGYLNNNI